MSACASAVRTSSRWCSRSSRPKAAADSDLLSRFVQEYFAASSIDSPYVAKVFEHGFTESHAYIVMEYFPAGDLRARVARDRPSVEESLIIIGSILSALASVHAGGIIHRDLKPANVMFRDDGTIALVDFGSARRDADPVAKTLAGVVIGTPYYLSPEQALGGTADERSDLYSVGVMLYELLTGQRMYAAASLVALFEMHKNAPIPKLPENLARHQRFLERLVSKKPDERYRERRRGVRRRSWNISMSEARARARRRNWGQTHLPETVCVPRLLRANAFLRAASNSSPGFQVGISSACATSQPA